MKMRIPRLSWLLALSLTLSVGCGEEAAEEPAPDVVDDPAETPAEPEEVPSEPPGPSARGAGFELVAEAQESYAPGEEGSFVIRLTPRGEYHVNQLFPMAVALAGPDAVTLPGAELSNEDAAEFSEQIARFEVPVTCAEAGEHQVTAEVDFAVCTEETCVPDHRTLALVLPVQ